MMDGVLAAGVPVGEIVSILIPLVLIPAVLWFTYVQHKRWKEHLRVVAARYGGRVPEGAWSGNYAECAVDETPFRIEFFNGGKNSSPYTRVRFSWTPPGTLRLAPEGFWTGVRKLFGAQDLRLGNAAFDERFLIQGAPEAWVRGALTPELQGEIRALADSLGVLRVPGGVRIEAVPSGVTVACARNLAPTQADLEEFVDRAVRIFRCLRSSGADAPARASADVEFLKVDRAVTGECPVCGGPFEGALRNCPACATPHHADCWAYFGGCAIYACGSGRRR